MTHRGHVGAEGVCRVLLELAVDHFAETGRDELIAWEFGSSRELGEFLMRQADRGAIELSSGDSLAGFDGWYDLRADPATWKLQW